MQEVFSSKSGKQTCGSQESFTVFSCDQALLDVGLSKWGDCFSSCVNKEESFVLDGASQTAKGDGKATCLCLEPGLGVL